VEAASVASQDDEVRRRVASRKGRKGGGKGTAARRQAQMDRLAAGSGGAGDARRARARQEAADAAAAGPSAARWLLSDAAGDTVAVDVVADLLRLGPGATLRGRGGDDLRALAGHVTDLIAADATAPSGRPLAEVATDDAELRDQLRPSLDLDALLSGGPVAGDHADRTVRVAEALLARAAQHRSGEVDLHQLVAPVGSGRHPRADEVEATVRVAVGGLDVPASPEPAVVTVTGGWIGVGPVELFLAAGRGLLGGAVAEVGGAALAAWLHAVVRHPGEPRWTALTARIAADAAALIETASSRAGSDHPDVVGPALVELIALQHPIARPD
jgi:hypothetical protein